MGLKKILSSLFEKVKFNLKLYVIRDKKYLAYKKWVKENPNENIRYNYELNQSSVVFDCGGYEGEFSNRINNEYLCKIYIFEPYPKYFQKIKEKFTDYKNINCYQLALSNKKNEMMMFDEGLSTNLIELNNSKEGTKVKVINITNFISQNDIKFIDLLKLNVEGSEYEIIEELITTNFISKVKDIQVQFHRTKSKGDLDYLRLRDMLSKTHKLTFDYYMIWENWTLKA